MTDEIVEHKGVTHSQLTQEQQEKWSSTISMMTWTAPGFLHLMYKLLNAQNNAPGAPHVAIMSKDCSIAATDGHNIMVNPDTFFGPIPMKDGKTHKPFTLPERVFIMCHEIVHNVFGDVELLHRCVATGKVPMADGTRVPFDMATMQIAMDARINALLIESRFGKPPADIGHFDADVKGSDSVLDVYKRYYEDKFPDGKGHDPGSIPDGFDLVMAPGSTTGQNAATAAQQRNPGQWAMEIAAAQQVQDKHDHGRMSAGLKRMFQSILEPEVPWLDHIETLINRATGSGGYDWTSPNDWLGGTPTGDQYFCPKENGHGAGWIVVWGDTSGSRNSQEIASNIAELAGIMEDVNPQRLTVLWCDAAIGQIDEIEDIADLAAIQSRGTFGGGGTDYGPVLDWIRDQPDQPDLFIGFTDGYVDFPEREHTFPTIWASSTDGVAYPFGQVVRVNKIARGGP